MCVGSSFVPQKWLEMVVVWLKVSRACHVEARKWLKEAQHSYWYSFHVAVDYHGARS